MNLFLLNKERHITQSRLKVSGNHFENSKKVLFAYLKASEAENDALPSKRCNNLLYS